MFRATLAPIFVAFAVTGNLSEQAGCIHCGLPLPENIYARADASSAQAPPQAIRASEQTKAVRKAVFRTDPDGVNAHG